MSRDAGRTTREADQPVRITTARLSEAEERAQRQRRYLAAMSLRSLSFIGMVLDYTLGGPTWVWIACIPAAILLPYIAVVLANAALTKTDDFALRPATYDRPQLTSGSSDA